MLWSWLQRRPLLAYLAYRTLALTWAFAPFQVYYLQRRGLSVADVFDLNVVFCVAAVAFEVPTGMGADRYGRRVAMSAGGFVMSLACLLFIFGHSFSTFAAANVLCALAMSLSSGADSAYLYDHLAAQRQVSLYPRWEGWSTAAKGVGNLVAVLVGALVYQYVHPTAVFVLTAFTTAVAGVIALSLPERATAHEGHVADHLRRAFHTLRTNGRLASVVAFGAIAFVLLRLSLFADQPHLEAHLHGTWLQHTVLTMGLLAAAKEVGTALVAGSVGSLFARVRSRTIAVTLGVGLTAAYLLMGEAHGTLCIVLMVLLASAFGVFSPLMRALMNRLIEGPRDRATLLSVEGMGRRLLFAATSPLFGRAVEASSLHATFSGTAWVAALAFALLGAFAWLAFRAPAASATSPAPRSSQPAVASLAR
ncbi:MAG: MFS transporter [Myxococcaceae bacterium]|nr:MAG: MFS transporter [Myxococcaceae bacterium]